MYTRNAFYFFSQKFISANRTLFSVPYQAKTNEDIKFVDWHMRLSLYTLNFKRRIMESVIRIKRPRAAFQEYQIILFRNFSWRKYFYSRNCRLHMVWNRNLEKYKIILLWCKCLSTKHISQVIKFISTGGKAKNVTSKVGYIPVSLTHIVLKLVENRCLLHFNAVHSICHFLQWRNKMHHPMSSNIHRAGANQYTASKEVGVVKPKCAS